MYHLTGNENHINNHMNFSFPFGCQGVQNQTYGSVLLTKQNSTVEPGFTFFSLIFPSYFTYFPILILSLVFIFRFTIVILCKPSNLYNKVNVHIYTNHMCTNYTHTSVKMTILLLYFHEKELLYETEIKLAALDHSLQRLIQQVQCLQANYQNKEIAISHCNDIFFNITLLNTNVDSEFLESNF